MSDIMKSIPFGQLMEWILEEHKKTGQIFGIQKAYGCQIRQKQLK